MAGTKNLASGIELAMRKGRKRSRGAQSSESPNIFSDFQPEQRSQDSTRSMAQQISQNYRAPQGGGMMDVAQSAGMASGNPYAMGASLGLEVLQGAQKQQRQYKEDLYRSELQKLQRQQAATRDLVDLARGLKL